MSTIYKVLGKIRHNQDEYEAGQLVEAEVFGGEESESLGDLVRSEALQEVVGASTIEEAVDILAKQEEAAAEAAAVIAEATPKDTWGPQPDPVEEVVKDETVVAPEATDTTDTTPTVPESTDAPTTGEVNTGDVNAPATPEDAGDNL